MKYNAGYIESEGKWAVTSHAGKRYFLNSLTDCEAEANRLARIYTMQWHFNQVDELFKEGVDKGQFPEDEHWGDYVA